MSNYQAVFKRVEKKFLLTTWQYEELMSWIASKMMRDKFGVSTINNIYFDTPDFALIRRSIEKPVYKEKLRFRTYCLPNRDSESFVEIKKKYEGVVYKRRISMRYEDAFNYLYRRMPADEPCQITKEIDYFLSYYERIAPAMYIYYDRHSYYAAENKDLRITFDTNIRWRADNLYITEGNYGNKLLDDNLILMEIKIPGAMPVWLAHTLSELQIYKTSFSKYGTAYKQLMRINGVAI